MLVSNPNDIDWKALRLYLMKLHHMVRPEEHYYTEDDVQDIMLKYIKADCPIIYSSNYWIQSVRNMSTSRARKPGRVYPFSDFRASGYLDNEPEYCEDRDSQIEIWELAKYSEARKLLAIDFSLGADSIPPETRVKQCRLRRRLRKKLALEC